MRGFFYIYHMNILKILFDKYLFVLFYLGLFFINSIEVIDRSAQYWFSISLVNICLFAYLYFSGSNNKHFIKHLLKDKIIITFLIFLFLSLLSFFFSYNISESIITLFRYLTIFSAILLLSIYLKDSSFKIFSLIISVIFLIELYFTFQGYLSIISQTVYSFDFAIYLAGIGANKNITAALFCMQLPFIFFLGVYFKNYFFKILFSFLLAFSFYNVFILGSRTALIIILAQSVLFLILSLTYNKKIKSTLTSSYTALIIWFLPLIFSAFIYNSSVSASNNSSIVNRVSTIDINNGSVDERLKFYNYTIDYIISNPFTPLGIGNWKISSVNWDSHILNGYTVPYHAHNDFLELAAETTIFGSICYFLIFLFCALQLLKSINQSKTSYEVFFYISLLLSGSAFFIDSLLNFPISRPIQVMILVFIISYTLVSKFKTQKHE